MGPTSAAPDQSLPDFHQAALGRAVWRSHEERTLTRGARVAMRLLSGSQRLFEIA
jgi:hypothetical protein